MRRQNGNRYDSRQFSLGLTKELAYDYSEKERVQKDGIFGSFYLRSQQYKVEVDKETGKPKIDEGPTVEGLTTEEGESELLSAGFIRYLDQVVYEDGPKLKNDEAFDIPLDPRNRYASNAAVARLQRDTLNRSAKRMFGSLFEKQITQPVLK